MTAYALTPTSVSRNSAGATTATLVGPVPAGEEWIVDIRSVTGSNSGTAQWWLTDQSSPSDDKLRGQSSSQANGVDIERGLVVPEGWRVIATLTTNSTTPSCVQATGTRRLTE